MFHIESRALAILMAGERPAFRRVRQCRIFLPGVCHSLRGDRPRPAWAFRCAGQGNGDDRGSAAGLARVCVTGSNPGNQKQVRLYLLALQDRRYGKAGLPPTLNSFFPRPAFCSPVRWRLDTCASGSLGHRFDHRIRLTTASLSGSARLESGRDRQSHCETSAFTHFTLHVNLAPMGVHNPLDNRESKPGSALLTRTRLVYTVESVENPR